ncbi:MAG: hypothetical protein ACPGJV_16415, partial [Bacteriovoracaceae bacterium]
INNKVIAKRLEALLKSEAMNLGFPVFVSLCLTTKEVKKFLEKINFSETRKVLGFEYMTNFDKDSKMSFSQKLYIDSIFEGKNLYFYSPYLEVPNEFNGKYKKVKF